MGRSFHLLEDASQSSPPAGGEEGGIMFCRDLCVAEHPSRGACVEGAAEGGPRGAERSAAPSKTRRSHVFDSLKDLPGWAGPVFFWMVSPGAAVPASEGCRKACVCRRRIKKGRQAAQARRLKAGGILESFHL